MPYKKRVLSQQCVGNIVQSHNARVIAHVVLHISVRLSDPAFRLDPPDHTHLLGSRTLVLWYSLYYAEAGSPVCIRQSAYAIAVILVNLPRSLLQCDVLEPTCVDE